MGLVFFSASLLLLGAAIVVIERKRGHGWRAVGEQFVMIWLLAFLSGLPFVFPSSRRVVQVVLILLIVGSLTMAVVKWRRR